MPRYTQNAKEVLRDGKHFADCIDDGAAKMIAEALNERRGMPQTQQSLPLDDNGPLFVGASMHLENDVEIMYATGDADFLGHLPADRRYYPTPIPNTIETRSVECAPFTGPEADAYHATLPPLYHQVRQENDEYACSCGMRWDVADGKDHP